MLADCKVLLVEKVGVNPQEMLTRAGIEATNLYAGKPIEAALAELFAAKSPRDQGPKSIRPGSGWRTPCCASPTWTGRLTSIRAS